MPKVESIWRDIATAEDVCERWGIHRKTLSRWMSSGFIPGTKEPMPYMKIGRKIGFTKDHIAFIEARMVRQSRRKRAS